MQTRDDSDEDYSEEDSEDEQEEFFTVGSEDLLESRNVLAVLLII